MKVGALIELLKKCNPEDEVIVSLEQDDEIKSHGGIIGINEITKKSIGNVTILADEKE